MRSLIFQYEITVAAVAPIRWIRIVNRAAVIKAFACITSLNLSKYLPETCVKLNVKNVLFAVTHAARLFYPKADIDFPDENLVPSEDLKNLYKDVKFGKNILIGKNVKIGKNSHIASNSIIESNVHIGENCIIGSFVMIRNSIISNNVYIQDGSKIGVKGFGFIPLKDKNFRFPHIGRVILKDNVELGANCTIDRGSVDDTGDQPLIDARIKSMKGGKYLVSLTLDNNGGDVMAVVSERFYYTLRKSQPNKVMWNTIPGSAMAQGTGGFRIVSFPFKFSTWLNMNNYRYRGPNQLSLLNPNVNSQEMIDKIYDTLMMWKKNF